MVTRVPRANRAACGPAESLRLPEVEEPVREAVSALEEPRIDTLARIGDHPAAGELARLRLYPSLGDAPVVLAFLAGMIRARVLILAISLVVAAIVGFALLLVRRRSPPSA